MKHFTLTEICLLITYLILHFPETDFLFTVVFISVQPGADHTYCSTVVDTQEMEGVCQVSLPVGIVYLFVLRIVYKFALSIVNVCAAYSLAICINYSLYICAKYSLCLCYL